MGAENVNDGFGFNLLCWGTGNLISIPLGGILFHDFFNDDEYNNIIYTQVCFMTCLVITKFHSTSPALLCYFRVSFAILSGG